MPLSLAQMRRNYTLYGLRDDLVQDDPLVLFGQWLEQARKTEVAPVEANSMALATVDARAVPIAGSSCSRASALKASPFSATTRAPRARSWRAIPARP